MVVGNKRSLDDAMANKVKVSIKWGKETFSDVEVDLSSPPLVFKSQLFALSAVPPDRQKVMIKGGLLKDDEWGKQVPKEGATVMLMGSAEAAVVEAPAQAPTFIEDLPEAEQANLETKAYGSGLENLGNTCYMNSTVQCLYAIEPLRTALLGQAPGPAVDPNAELTRATRDLFADMKRGGEPFAPYAFLMTLRKKFPQFAQQGQGGAFMQQDAEECWTNLVYSLREKLKGAGEERLVDKIMGIGTKLKLKCEESGEELELEPSHSYMLKCNIDGATNHLHEGILLGLKDDRERHSEKLGQTAVFRGTSSITSLPQYLTVQMVRFFYKAAVQQKAKVLRKVSYGLELDVYDFCSPELKQQLDGPRAALKAHVDAVEAARKAMKKLAAEGEAGSKSDPAALEPGQASAGAGAVDVDMQDAAAAAGSSSSGTSSHVGAQTGKFQLVGCLTHKGRSADSGHYVAWIKQQDGHWVLFDDEDLSFKKDDDILALSGGGDWHMAYLLLYRAVTVPPTLDSAPAAK